MKQHQKSVSKEWTEIYYEHVLRPHENTCIFHGMYFKLDPDTPADWLDYLALFGTNWTNLCRTGHRIKTTKPTFAVWPTEKTEYVNNTKRYYK